MWNINFIKEEDFYKHVENTIKKYGDKLEPFDIRKFNKNIIDPIKLIFDKNIYSFSWEEIINSEIFRQRDKANNNDIGYFHQRIFKYIDNCRVPENGKDGGWDIIYEPINGITLQDGTSVKRIYVEMKNKHNTMNSSSAAKTFIKMQNQLLKDDSCACFLVEIIAQHSQNIKWETTVDKQKVSHKLIRKVSIDEFYSLVTGDKNAFYNICMILPLVIKKVIEKKMRINFPKDSVYDEIISKTKKIALENEEDKIALAFYILSFSDYLGFKEKKKG